MPKVSVIVTTYNRKEYLTETIQSIINQTYQDFELIVVDNYSNYDFYEHIESFKSEKIIPFQNQNNGIIAVNRNIGISHARGEYIAFCDDDDIWVQDKIEKQINHLQFHNADILYADLLCFNENGNNYIRKAKQILNISQLIRKNEINLSTVFIKNIPLIRFDEDPNLVTVEDYFLWLDLYESGLNFILINEPLTRYRISQDSMFLKQQNQIYCKLNYGLAKFLIQKQISFSTTSVCIKSMISNLIKLYTKHLLSKY